MPNQKPQLDIAKIAFPTDRLSIKDLRKLFPAEFDGPDERVEFFGVGGRGQDLEAVLQLEREIARKTFEVALGRAPSDWAEKYEIDPREDVAKSLIEYGLASGPNQAEQMIREIEAQATAQAKALGLPSRTQIQRN